MKNSYDFENNIDEKYKEILYHDKIEIDNPNKHHHIRINYIDRIKMIVSLVKKYFPIPDQINIGDFACGQGNISLLLAELGYKVFAIDLNPIFIEYSKMKYERGNIEWINENIDNLDFSENSLDVAIAGEIIEHCAYPEDILQKIFKFIRPRGILIITTPNASRIFIGLPTFGHLLNKEQRKQFMEKQFGPDDQDHLFLFQLDEIRYILPKEGRVIESGYLGGIFLINKYTHFFLKLVPIKYIEKVIRNLSKIPLINRRLYNHIYAVVKKKSVKLP